MTVKAWNCLLITDNSYFSGANKIQFLEFDLLNVLVLHLIFWFFYLSGASADDINVTIDVKEPFSVNGIKNLLVAFKGLLSNNYPAACLALGGTVMSLGYQRIIQAGGSCPVVLLTGDTETSKTTVLKACLFVTGSAEVKGY